MNSFNKEEMENFLKIGIDRAKSSLNHFFKLLDIDPSLFDHLFDIRIFIDYNNEIIELETINGTLQDSVIATYETADSEKDDVIAISKDYIEVLYGLIKRYNCDISIVLPQTFKENEEPSFLKETKYEKCFSNMEAMELMFYQNLFDNTAWGKLYHKSVFSTGIRYPKGLLYEDLPTTYLLFNQVKKIAFSNKRCYFYLLRGDSIEGSAFTPSKMDSALRIFDMMDKETDVISKIQKAYNCRMLSFSFHLLLKMPEKYENRKILYQRIKALRKYLLQYRHSS